MSAALHSCEIFLNIPVAQLGEQSFLNQRSWDGIPTYENTIPSYKIMAEWISLGSWRIEGEIVSYSKAEWQSVGLVKGRSHVLRFTKLTLCQMSYRSI